MQVWEVFLQTLFKANNTDALINATSRQDCLIVGYETIAVGDYSRGERERYGV